MTTIDMIQQAKCEELRKLLLGLWTLRGDVDAECYIDDGEISICVSENADMSKEDFELLQGNGWEFDPTNNRWYYNQDDQI
jgi:hypothetical protein